jgi:hypothetical protein
MMKTTIRNLDCMDLLIFVEAIISAGLLAYGIYLCWQINKIASL